MMLQQTQITTVKAKYDLFLRAFPNLRALANAPVAEVLRAWKGLGYNRRALALHRTAGILVSEHGGRLPRSEEALVALPGIGRATAGAILAFAFDLPAAFIETNIRRVFLHFFYPDERGVPDARILPLVKRTFDRSRPRDWYYALMDYGAMLPRTSGNANRRSAHYGRQAPFEGSLRQLRGRVLGVMLELGVATAARIGRALGTGDERLPQALQGLVRDGFLTERSGRYSFR